MTFYDFLWLSVRLLVAGERCNVTEEYFEKASMSVQKEVIGYQTLLREFCTINGEFSELRCLMNTL